MQTLLILIALCICMGVLQKAKGWKVGSWLQVAVVVVWMGSQFLGGAVLGTFLLSSGRGGKVTSSERVQFQFLYPAIGVGVLFLVVARFPSRRKPGAGMDSVEFCSLARKALLTAFPEFAPYYRESEGGACFEIRFPHPAVPSELLVTSRDREISICFDGTHRHGGMNEDLSPAMRIEGAVAFLRSLFDGAIPLVRDIRWEGYSFCEEPEIWKNDPERNLVVTTWAALGRAS